MHASKGNNFAGSISNKYEGLAGLPVRNQSCCFAYAVFQIVSTKEVAKRLILWASDFGTLPSGLTRCERYPSAADVRMCWPSPCACQVSIATRQTDSLSCRSATEEMICCSRESIILKRGVLRARCDQAASVNVQEDKGNKWRQKY